jgi:cardiolipin synthase (CMP-forming)
MSVLLPNLFTVARLVLAPFIVHAILNGRYGRALALFAAAALSDSLDGMLARRLDATSRAGAYLDPIADKVLMSAVFIALAFSGLAPWWYVGVVFGRDVLILFFALAALRFSSRRDFHPSVWGKASTFFQVLTAVSLLAAPLAFSRLILWISAVLTVWSGLHYAVTRLRYSRD